MEEIIVKDYDGGSLNLDWHRSEVHPPVQDVLDHGALLTPCPLLSRSVPVLYQCCLLQQRFMLPNLEFGTFFLPKRHWPASNPSARLNTLPSSRITAC
jgi:hypothetical protein